MKFTKERAKCQIIKIKQIGNYVPMKPRNQILRKKVNYTNNIRGLSAG